MKRTEIVFILDKSGSMAGLEEDTIGGFNALLKKQQKAEGEAFITTVLFDHRYEILHERIHVKEVSPLTENDYEAGGTTALLDAIGFSIQKMISVQKRACENERVDKVLFVITTDGMENASKEYTADRIKKIVQYQKQEYGWDFLFLGANIDAISAAAQYGIHEEFAVNYHADEKGTQLNFEAVNEAVMDIRSGKSIDSKWKDVIEKDYRKRSSH